MNRAALEHILRAASAASGEREFIVIGSQAILGQFPAAPAALLTSIEADIYPRHAPKRSDVVDGALGELSECHQSFGYYAHGVDDTTAILPAGWAARLVRLENANTGGGRSGGASRPTTWHFRSWSPAGNDTCGFCACCYRRAWWIPACWDNVSRPFRSPRSWSTDCAHG
jgi:hypothetical protein